MSSVPMLNVFLLGLTVAFAAPTVMDFGADAPTATDDSWLDPEPSKPAPALVQEEAVQEEAEVDQKLEETSEMQFLRTAERAEVDQKLEETSEEAIAEDAESGDTTEEEEVFYSEGDSEGDSQENNIQEESSIDDEFEKAMQQEEEFHKQHGFHQQNVVREREAHQKRIDDLGIMLRKMEPKREGATSKENVLKRKKVDRRCQLFNTNKVDFIMSHLEDGEDAEVLSKTAVTCWVDCVKICQSNPICKQVVYAKDAGFCTAISSKSFPEAPRFQKVSEKYMVANCIDPEQANGRRLNEF